MEATESSGSTTTGPATFQEAFAADASSASNTQQTGVLTDSTSADATVPPVTATDGSTPTTGEPPKERWADILENTRTKTRAEVEAQWESQYGWAKQIPQQDLQQAIALAQRASSQPIEYLQEFIKELQNHPTYGAQLKSLAARALSQRQPAVEPQLESIPVELPDGRTVQLVTADSQAKREAWLREQVMQQATEKFSPFTKTVEQLQAERAALAQQQAGEQFVAKASQEISTWPHMDVKEHRDALAKELAKLPDSNDPATIEKHLNHAYRIVLRTVVNPTQAAKSESSVLENLQRKAAASSGINPSSVASATAPSYKSFKDLPPEAWR